MGDTSYLESKPFIPTCAICMNSFEKRYPRILECGHTYCTECIYNSILLPPYEPICKVCTEKTEKTKEKLSIDISLCKIDNIKHTTSEHKKQITQYNILKSIANRSIVKNMGIDPLSEIKYIPYILIRLSNCEEMNEQVRYNFILSIANKNYQDGNNKQLYYMGKIYLKLFEKKKYSVYLNLSLHFLMKASEHGNSEAQYALGVYYEKQDFSYSLAKYYYELASKNGSIRAKLKLANMHSSRIFSFIEQSTNTRTYTIY